MTTSFNSKIQSTILIGSLLMVSACASFNSGETIASKTDEAARIAIEKAKLETPPEPPASVTTVIEPVKTAPETAPDAAQAPKSAVARINQKEPLVNVRTAPSLKSRVVAVLKRGQSIEVLETKDSWVKITWHKGRAVKQGWLKKAFVEGYEQ